MADQKGFLQNVIGELGDFVSWTLDKMQNWEFRKMVLLDLGLDPNEEDEFPESSSIDNINAYRNAVDPDKEALKAAIQDLKAFYHMIKEYIILRVSGDNIDEYGYRSFEFFSTHYLRTTQPEIFYLSELLDFLVESRLSVEGAVRREGANVANVWNLLTDPFGYLANLLKKLFDSGYDLRLISVATVNDLPSEGRSLVVVAEVGGDLHIRMFNGSREIIVDKPANELVEEDTQAQLVALTNLLIPFPDESHVSEKDKKEIIKNATAIAGLKQESRWLRLHTTEDAEANSVFFLVLPLLLKISDNDPNMRFLYSWDRVPRKFSEATKGEFRSSYRGVNLLEKVKSDLGAGFEGSVDAPDDDWWTYIEETTTDGDPSVAEKAIKEAYLLAIERWKRGEWEDNVSETAFSFDFEYPDADNKNVQCFMGGTLLFVSKEDFPTDLLSNDGVEVVPSGGLFASLNGEFNFKYPLGDDWELAFKTSSGNLLDVFLSQNSDLNILGDMSLKAELKKKANKATGATYNLPNASGNRFAVGEIKIAGLLSLDEVGLEIGLKENAFVFSAKEADSFLRKVMPPGEVPLKFSLVGGISRKKGFYFKHDIDFLNDLLGPEEAEESGEASAVTAEAEETDGQKRALDLKFPIHKDMGIIDFKNLKWSLGKTEKENALGAKLSIAITVTSKIGPVAARVEEIGMRTEVSMPEEGGDLETTELDFGFLPPKGVGIRIDAEAISGGGFLELDSPNHRYAGVLALDFFELQLAAVGLINTRLPNNQPGFSMLVSISVLFDPPLQLPYQFSLNGVGGIVGINRTMKVDVLQDRIRDGAIDSIMFPKNVIENSAKIISDLRAVFPPQESHYVAAPFLRIGWGKTTIVEVDLGIFLEFPFSGRLIILGALGVYLPNKDVADRLVEIHVDVFGDFNFAESYVLIEGRLRNSEIKGVPLSGGFAFVLDWGSSPQFLLSVGGYHPRYQKPARFPDIPRLSAQIKRGDDFRVSCKYYQAITSNSFQIGFSADLLVKKGKAIATGFFSMNALLQFDPLYFEFDIKISIQIAYRGRTFAGVDLEFLLSGPKPWRATGFAKIKLLFFSLKVKFNYSWGGEQEIAPIVIQSSQLLSDLKRQLEQENNWTAKLPTAYRRAEALRTVSEPDTPDRIFVHPSGFLELRQTLIPLNRTIGKVGNSQVENEPEYRIESYQLGNGQVLPVAQQGMLREHFGRAQFEALTDEEKISAPDFELMTAGANLVTDQAFDLAADMESIGNEFEDIILGDLSGEKQAVASYNWQEQRSRNIAGGRKTINPNRPEEVFGLIDSLPDYGMKTYEIVSKTTLQRPEELMDRNFWSYSEAKDYLQSNWEDGWKEWQIREVVEETVAG